ncbi:SprT family zinc-dependent metalloprotease [Octadecabacter sp. 1_MG-2023]|uniref:M48 family metallopeptidase n=1 Tax=unclassified Octadecabacter TaxID=196158 RepID=UPI001C0A43C3|nr:MULTISPECIES: SprT family zinc-dependent metalloprotease [unclassified Octadecabacter]MBU2991760.1 M48 family metallopeptidase [Octadecabacter sp. B2R22]MDO6735733.1 SprT family zinc-dependent metalloprotease [Octadecabacter sp. 1_MG-2023]
MSVLILDGNPPVEVVLRRSARARRLSLRISRLDGRATLTLPNRVPEREGMAFLREREDWLRKHLDAIEPEQLIQIGGTVPYLGQELPLIAGDVKRAKLSDGALMLPDSPEMAGKRVAAFMKLRARDALADASDRYAAALGRPYGRISLRDTRSRWGSCSSAGDLMYSWRLIMAPPQVLDYVAAHEVAHLQHMDHSDRFWGVVDRLFPDHKACRAWLRRHGGALHRVRFD